MNKILLVTFLLFCSSYGMKAQSISCQDLFNTVVEHYDSGDQTSCYGSTMLSKAIYYRLEGMGFVVAYIKSSDYDFSG